MSLLLRDLLARDVVQYGDEPAVVFRDVATSWRTLQERAFRLANRLAAEGVGREDRIAILQGNGPELGEVAFAAALLGAVVVPVSTRSAPAEAQFVCADAGARIAFVGAPYAELLSGVGVGVGVATVQTGEGEAYERFLSEGDAAEPPRAEHADDVVMQLYTSGTTGRPKGALLTQRAMIQNGLTTALSQRLTHDDVFLTMTPITHAAGATRIFSLAIDGICNVVLERFEPAAALAAIERHRVTSTIAVPAILRALLDAPELERTDLSSLRQLIYGAAPTPRPLIEEALRRLPCGFLHAYGLTEGCPALTALGPEEHRLALRDPSRAHLLDSVGRAVPGVRLAVGGPDAPHSPGETGELWVQSTKSMAGYHGQPEATAAVLRDGWLATGDVGRVDEEGYVYLVDRAKDMLISGGFNVYPSEIERVLHASGRLADVSVIGVEDERWGEVPVAFVVPNHDAPVAAAELQQCCEQELARYKIPHEFVVVERLPRSETGKILKRELRRRWTAEHGKAGRP